MVRWIDRKTKKNLALNLLCYVVLIRVITLFFYEGYSIFPDSEGYIELGNQLSTLNLNGYSGKRTPGYPILIALTGNNLIFVKIIQIILGAISTFLLYDLVKKETKNNLWAFLTAIFATSFVHFIFFEAAILTETLTLFVLLLSFWLIRLKECLDARVSYSNLILLSALFAYLYFIRPMFIYVPIGFALFYLVKNLKFNYKKAIYKSLLVLIFPLIAFYSWSSLNKKNIGVFGSTYFLGINLTQTATPFFELVSDEHKEIRDIIVKHRDSIANIPDKNIAMSIWAAYDELLKETQLTPPQLSEKLGGISTDLFKKHPELYIKQVSISWLHFWKESLLWNPKQIKSTFLKNILMGTWLYIQQWVGMVLSILFIFFGLKHIFRFFKLKCMVYDFNFFLILIILSGSIAQALITFGSNNRFSFPYFPLIIYIVFINLFTLKSKNATDT
ncbi:MAG: hypothetical protein R2785_10055 [Flavobacteriaceae bacterium]